jgi:UDP-GlcNAc:undecaprenyl-phosphate/decaprenyl-phosphate GlcNAc-1-phosphate transferase
VILFIGLYLGRVRVYEGDEQPAANNTIVNVLTDFTHKRRVFEILLDVMLVVLAYNWAYMLRFDGNIPPAQMDIFLKTLPLVIAIQMSFFLLCGVYRGLWRYAGIADLTVIAKAVASGVVATATIVFLMFKFNGPSRAIFVLNGLVLLLMVGASRVSFRMIRSVIIGKIEPAPDARPVVIYGAGDGGELLLRELLNNAEHRFAPVAFIDDDPHKVGKVIHGYEIHSREELPDLIKRHGVSDVVVSSLKVPESRLGYLREFGITPGRLSIRIE